MEADILKSTDLKSTKKRRLLLTLLKEQDHAITAEDLYEKAKKIIPINLSTVYRSLTSLTQKGLLSKNIHKDGKAYYQIQNHQHQHNLNCIICHETIPVDECPLTELEETLSTKTGYQITGHILQFSGICPNCAKNNSTIQDENQKKS